VNHDLPFTRSGSTKENKARSRARLMALVEVNGRGTDRAGALYAGAVRDADLPEMSGRIHQIIQKAHSYTPARFKGQIPFKQVPIEGVV